jgi:hypothetical protein
MIYIEDFLKAHPLINIKGLERECKLPSGTIRQALNYNRQIPVKYENQILEVLKKYGFEVVKLGNKYYKEGDIVHFGVPNLDELLEARLYWSDVTYGYILQPTGRTIWIPGYEFINTILTYYE